MRVRVRVCVQGGSTLCVCVCVCTRPPAHARAHAATGTAPRAAPAHGSALPLREGMGRTDSNAMLHAPVAQGMGKAGESPHRAALAAGRKGPSFGEAVRYASEASAAGNPTAPLGCHKVRARARVRALALLPSPRARARALDAVCARARGCARVRVCACGRASRLTRARAGRAGGRAARGTRAHRCTAAAAAAAAHTTTSAARTRASIRATLIPSVFQRCFVSAPSCACARSRRRGGACAGGRARSGARPERVPRAPTVLTSRRGLRSPSSPLPSLAPSRACLRS